jgi:hypothetical protein
MLIEEVENEIREKESFVVTQNDRVKTMFEVLNELKEYSIVLDKANKVIHGRLRGVVGESPMSLQSDHDIFGVAAGAAAVKPSGIHRLVLLILIKLAQHLPKTFIPCYKCVVKVYLIAAAVH